MRGGAPGAGGGAREAPPLPARSGRGTHCIVCGSSPIGGAGRFGEWLQKYGRDRHGKPSLAMTADLRADSCGKVVGSSHGRRDGPTGCRSRTAVLEGVERVSGEIPRNG